MNDKFQTIAAMTVRLEENPRDAEALEARARTFLDMHQWKEAKEDIEHLLCLNCYAEALSLLDAAVGMDAEMPWPYLLRGFVHYHLHAPADAAADLQRLAELAPDAVRDISGEFGS